MNLVNYISRSGNTSAGVPCKDRELAILYRKNQIRTGLFRDPRGDSVGFLFCAVTCCHQLTQQDNGAAIIHIGIH